MRVCLVSTSSISADPRARAEMSSTRRAGHDVVEVSSDQLGSLHRGVVARLTGKSGEPRHSRLTELAVAAKADLYVPVGPHALEVAREAAERTDGVFLTKPAWGQPSRHDLVWRAPEEPSLAPPASGHAPQFHVPGASPLVPRPITGPVVVAYRKTERNPGRYIEAALQRFGIETLQREAIRWNDIPEQTMFVLVVESPLPALPISGQRKGIPVVFWVHHGEHHLETNLRLQNRYEADLVALAHSWHLAYRFRGGVERLPFGVAPEITERGFRPHADRSLDVAFVGSASRGTRYDRRQTQLAALRKSIGSDRVIEASSVSPEEMARLYRDARIVPDDGWGRHLPITMRVFEATGSGAALVSRTSPGLDLILDPETQYIPMSADPEQLHQLLRESVESVGRNGHTAVWRSHTYDTRVLELMSMLEHTREMTVEWGRIFPEGLAAAVSRFPDAQRILDLHGGVSDDLRDREVWDFSTAAARARESSFHVSVVAGGTDTERSQAVHSARLAVVAPRGLRDELAPLVGTSHGHYSTWETADTVTFSFGASGYRASSEPDPV